MRAFLLLERDMKALGTDQRKARLAAFAKWGLGLTAAVLIAPFIFLAVKGIVGLAVALILGLGIIHGAPVLGMKFANWKLAGMKWAARTNPIETRQNIAVQARQRIDAATEELKVFSTEVRMFSQEVEDLRRAQPEDVADFEEQLIGLQRLLALKTQGIKDATAKANDFEQATQRAARKWKVAQSALRMKKLSGSVVDNEMNKLLAAESLDSVQTAMNSALADLDIVLALQKMPAFEHPTTIDVNAVEIRERVRL